MTQFRTKKVRGRNVKYPIKRKSKPKTLYESLKGGTWEETELIRRKEEKERYEKFRKLIDMGDSVDVITSKMELPRENVLQMYVNLKKLDKKNLFTVRVKDGWKTFRKFDGSYEFVKFTETFNQKVVREIEKRAREIRIMSNEKIKREFKGKKLSLLYYHIFEDANYHSLNDLLSKLGVFGKFKRSIAPITKEVYYTPADYGRKGDNEDYEDYRSAGGKTWDI